MADPLASLEGREHLSYHLPVEFVRSYVDRDVDWGFSVGAGNTLGEVTFISKHSQLKADGTKEQWWEVCRRVTEGVYSTVKDHCLRNRTPWTDEHAHEDATQMFDRMFRMLWMPPGRGVEFMGTPALNAIGSAVLQNCAALSTEDIAEDPTWAFCMLMEMSMLGIGVGIDTRGAGKCIVRSTPFTKEGFFQVPDSREGWVEALRLKLWSWFDPEAPHITYDVSLVRPKGAVLKTLGGHAGGPESLMQCLHTLDDLLGAHRGLSVSSRLITDIANVVGRCAVQGNKRRTALIVFGDPSDKDFLHLKDWTREENAERLAQGTGWGHLSNNSALAEASDDLSHLAEAIQVNGEPGIMFLDLARSHGRLADPPNWKNSRVMLSNPCAEMPLENAELCTLVETYPSHHNSIEDFLRTLKYAYLYGKAVTLIPTHWPKTNEVMIRNRRIGLSMSGLWEFVEAYSRPELKRWCEVGYAEVCRRDTQYSDWLGIRESVGKTTVKPSGSVSLEAGVTPGVHAPIASGRYFRRQRFGVQEPLVEVLRDAGYPVEPDVQEPDRTVVVTFPVTAAPMRSEQEASVWEKASLAALLQAHWSDNMVSATFSFKPTEADQVAPLINAFTGQLKSMSFLPLEPVGGKYPQMPYESVSDEDFEGILSLVRPIDREALYSVQQAPTGDRYCDSDKCDTPTGAVVV